MLRLRYPTSDGLPRMRAGGAFDINATKEFMKAFGDNHFQIEYTEEAFRKSCTDRGGKGSIIRRDRKVVPYGHSDYVYEVCPAS